MTMKNVTPASSYLDLEVYDDMALFSGLKTAWKTEFEIHISNPQRWTSEFQDKREENQY